MKGMLFRRFTRELRRYLLFVGVFLTFLHSGSTLANEARRSCNDQSLQVCLNHGGGTACYAKHCKLLDPADTDGDGVVSEFEKTMAEIEKIKKESNRIICDNTDYKQWNERRQECITIHDGCPTGSKWKRSGNRCVKNKVQPEDCGYKQEYDNRTGRCDNIEYPSDCDSDEEYNYSMKICLYVGKSDYDKGYDDGYDDGFEDGSEYERRKRDRRERRDRNCRRHGGLFSNLRC